MKLVGFLVYLFIEVFVTVPIASEVGALYTFLIIVFTAVFGIFLFVSTPFKMAELMQNVLNNFSFAALGFSTILRVIAAIFLILPGFFGDMLGVLLLIGSFLLAPRLNRKDRGDDFSKNNKNNNEEIIDVEIIDDSTPR